MRFLEFGTVKKSGRKIHLMSAEFINTGVFQRHG